MDNSTNLLLKYIEESKVLCDMLRGEILFNLNKKYKKVYNPITSQDKVKQVLTSFAVNAAMNYAHDVGKPDEWSTLFKPKIRRAVAQILREQYESTTGLFSGTSKEITKLPEEEPQPEEKPTAKPVEKLDLEDFEDALEQPPSYIAVDKLIDRLDNAASKKRIERLIEGLNKTKLRMICDRLCLADNGSERTLKDRIVKAYWGLD